MNIVQNELSPTDKKSREKQQKIKADGQKLQNQLQEQQRRLNNAKSELAKRRKDQEAAHLKYLKYKERGDKNIQEEDKLRVTNSDKEALVERANEEFNRQVYQSNQIQAQYYNDSLPNLCRSRQETHKNLTACWKVCMKDLVKFAKSDNDIEHKKGYSIIIYKWPKLLPKFSEMITYWCQIRRYSVILAKSIVITTLILSST